MVLSENRAKAIVDYLVEKGIAANRLSYEGHGFSQPVGDNDTWLGRHQNRRIEITFNYD
jgi:outer membrane protein OmpA-like peptidoglycan-associated protein